MCNTSGNLFDFLESAFGIVGFGRSARPGYGTAKNATLPKAEIRQNTNADAANENEARGLAPIVSVAVSVCPVPPVVKRAS